MRRKQLPNEPIGSAIESECFLLEVTCEHEGDPKATITRIANAASYENSIRAGKQAAALAPMKTTVDDTFVRVQFAGMRRRMNDYLVEEWRAEGGASWETQSAVTTYKVREYFEKRFSASCEVIPLFADGDHPDDLAIIDELTRSSEWWGNTGYPTPTDLENAGKQEGSLLAQATKYASDSPYFRAELISKTPFENFNSQAASAAAKTLARTTGIRVSPLGVYREDSGHWRMHLVGFAQSHGVFASLKKKVVPYNEITDALGHYFASNVILTTYGTTIEDAEGIIEAEKTADLLDLVDGLEPEDFAVTTKEEYEERFLREMETVSGFSERTGVEELDELIGLGEVKEQILEFLAYAKSVKERGGQMPSLHMYMTGNPGTGKTTLARIIGHLMYDMGLIPKPNVFVEGDRETLVSAFLGNTAGKTKRAIRKARHGVLFIDEAYALAGKTSHDYGSEALATLVKAMEDSRNDFERNGFVCIMAGYPELMEEMISTNPGLRDRFGFHLHFPDYDADELQQIFELYASREGLTFTEAASSLSAQMWVDAVAAKTSDFANGRLVRKVFERVKMRQARFNGASSAIDVDVLESVLADPDIAPLFTKNTTNSAPMGLIK